MVEAAVGGGVNCFDTAAAYGTSEEVLGRALRELLRHCGLLHYFDYFVFSDEVGYSKPDPRAFHLALESFGDPDPADVVFVDDQQSNLRGAEAVGIATVYFDPTDAVGSIERIEAALA